MKKILQILLLLIGLTGCASFEFEEIATLDSETARILELGLSHEENLSEAQKLSDSHEVAIVIAKLNQAENMKNKASAAALDISEYAENVQVKNGEFEINFNGPKISDTKRTGMLDEFDYENYYLKGQKDKNTGLIKHQLYLAIQYTWKQRRNYSSASFCDKWQGCKDAEKVVIDLISSSASNCTPEDCMYTEEMELSLSDDFLRSNSEDKLSLTFNSKKAANNITLTSSYMKGYLQVAN